MVESTSHSAKLWLVIGCGFIGASIANELARSGAKVRVLTRSEPRHALHDGVAISVGNAEHRHVVDQALENVDHVVYTASGLLPAESVMWPAEDVKLAIPPLLTVLEALAQRSATLTYLSSGGMVYGRPALHPTPEDAPTIPITSYGVTKLACERYVTMYHAQYGLTADILRPSNVYGPGQPTNRSQGVIGIFAARMLAHQPLAMFGDGFRDYVHVRDLASAIMSLTSSRSGCRTLNVGSGEVASVSRLVELLGAGLDSTSAIHRAPARSTDIERVELDITRLRQAAPGWSPISLEAGIGEYASSLLRTNAQVDP